MTIKQALYNQCLEFVDNRLQTIQNTIKEIQEALLSETKSTAGDKHETGRAMLQLEREKSGRQLAEINKTKEILSKINIEQAVNTIALGSVVYTTNANYFIAVSAGELQFENQTFYAISTSTPIGQLLIGKTFGNIITFRGKDMRITEVH